MRKLKMTNNKLFTNRFNKVLASLLFTSVFLVNSNETAAAINTLEADIQAAINSPVRPTKDQELDPLRKPAEILSFFGIKKGMHVIDVFSGPGYYTELLSHLVGKTGKVAMHNHSLWEAYSKKASDARIAITA